MLLVRCSLLQVTGYLAVEIQVGSPPKLVGHGKAPILVFETSSGTVEPNNNKCIIIV